VLGSSDKSAFEGRQPEREESGPDPEQGYPRQTSATEWTPKTPVLKLGRARKVSAASFAEAPVGLKQEHMVDGLSILKLLPVRSARELPFVAVEARVRE